MADIIDKKCHLTDPSWLMRVGVYLELLTCIGIAEAVRDDIGDLLDPDEREAFEHSESLCADTRASESRRVARGVGHATNCLSRFRFTAHRCGVGVEPATQRFVVEGHMGTSLFLVGEGLVEVRRRNATGGDDVVDIIRRGEVVGEMALLTGAPRSATVRSIDESVVYEISRQLYEPIVHEHPAWLPELARIMEERLARGHRVVGERAPPAGSIVDVLRQSFFG